MDIPGDKFLEEFGLKGCSLMVSKGECFVDLLALALLVKGLKVEGPFQSIGWDSGHPCPIWVPSKYFCKGSNVPTFQTTAHN